MFEQLKQILVEELQLSPEEITPNAELIKDLGVNSLELADLILLCEEKFNIEVKDEDIHKFITIQNVVDFLEQNA
jgi:acyl carrier protein